MIALAVTAIAVIAVCVAFLSWLRPNNAALDQVSVVPDAMFCDGKPVDYRIMTEADPFFDGIPDPAFELSAGPSTECMLRVVVSNPGSRAVNLGTVSLPGMGVDASPILRAVRLNYGADDIDTDCRREDFTEGVSGLPHVEVSRGGRHRTIDGAVSLVIHSKGAPKDECG